MRKTKTKICLLLSIFATGFLAVPETFADVASDLAFYKNIYDTTYTANQSSLNSSAASGVGYTYYSFQYALEPTVSMYEATKDETYLLRALAWSETMMNQATIVDSNGNKNWKGYDGRWASPYSTTPISYHLYDEQGATGMARVARIILLDPALKTKYGTRAQKVFDFVKNEIVEKIVWKRAGYSWFINNACEATPTKPILDQIVLMMKIESDLYRVNRDVRYKDMMTQMGTCFKRRIKPHTAFPTALIYDQGLSWDVGATADDTSHANRQPWAVEEMYEMGLVFTTKTEIDGFSNLLVDVIWNKSTSDPMFSNYIDGLAVSSRFPIPGQVGQIYSGWATLGRYNARVQSVSDAVLRAIMAGKKNASLNYMNHTTGKMSLAGHLARNIVLSSGDSVAPAAPSGLAIK